jgi:ABC-2 type transport system ATP-binding protein
MMSDFIIELNNVTKMYGKSRGILDVDLKVPRGSIFGFLGPNGAGKTTTISMLIDLIHPTKGQIKLFGLDSVKDSCKIRKKVGFLGGDMALDEPFTGWQQLEYFGHLRGYYDENYIEELANKLDCDLNRKIKTLSRGNRQKVGLISALMHKPELLILDEPTSGLDPLVQDQFNQIVLDYRKQGKTIFISSHILSEVEQLCDRVAFVREGRLIADKPIQELTVGLAKHVKIVSNDKTLIATLKKLPSISHFRVNDSLISFQFDGKITELIKLLTTHKISDVNITPPDLDTIFSKFYGTDYAK